MANNLKFGPDVLAYSFDNGAGELSLPHSGTFGVTKDAVGNLKTVAAGFSPVAGKMYDIKKKKDGVNVMYLRDIPKNVSAVERYEYLPFKWSKEYKAKVDAIAKEFASMPRNSYAGSDFYAGGEAGAGMNPIMFRLKIWGKKLSKMFKTMGAWIMDKLTKFWNWIVEKFAPVSEAVSNYFKNTPNWQIALHAVIFAAVVALLAFIGRFLYKKYKNSSKAKTRESYLNTLNRQSFIEAKNVASFLKENTSMSKKECNKVANYVYKNSLTRKINNLI